MSKLLKKKSVTQLLEHNQSKALTKTLGAFDLIMLGVGSIIGTGVLVLTGLVAARDAGPAVIFSFVLAVIICGFIALCYAEIASTLPASGSVYTYSYATIGEFVAHLVGLVFTVNIYCGNSGCRCWMDRLFPQFNKRVWIRDT